MVDSSTMTTQGGRKMNIPHSKVELTDRERELLHQIVEDKYSVGAFAGMIFNAYIQGGNSMEKLIKHALCVRLTMKDLVAKRDERK
jgi:hypothetical protein